MAVLTEQQIIDIRRQVGNAPIDDTLQEVYDRVGTTTATILEILEIRAAELRRAPTSFSIPGEYSQSTSDNLRSIEARIASLGGSGSTGTLDFIEAPVSRIR